MYELDRDIELSKNSFTGHKIASEDESRATIRNPDNSNYWTEIIQGQAGLLVIAGDGPDIALRTYRSGSTIEGLVRWCAGSNLDYLATKVAIGTARKHCPDAMAHDLREYCVDQRDALGELPYEECDDAAAQYAAGIEGVEELELVADGCYDLTEGECWRRITDVCSDLGEYKFGQRYTSDLIAGREACRRLVELWDERKPDVTNLLQRHGMA